jgi:hypothetical protein
MPFIVLVIAAIILITAIHGTHGDLATALEQDIPGYFKWAAAIAAIIGLGYLPGFERISRWLLVLVAVVVVLTQGKGIFAGFQQFLQGTTQAQHVMPVEPTAPYVETGQATPSQTAIAGLSGDAPTTAPAGVAATAYAATGLSISAGMLALQVSPSIGFGGSGDGAQANAAT